MRRLSDAFVAALEMPPGKTDHYEWDAARELAVRLRKRGPRSKLSRKWYKGGNVNGRWKPILIGDVRQIKAETAYGAAQHISAQLAIGEDPTARRKKARADAKARAKAQELKLGAMIKRYLTKKEKEVKPGTYTEAKYYLEKLWQPLHNEPITDIKPTDVALVLEDVAGTRGRPSARSARSCLRAFYGWAMCAGLCETNPVVGSSDPARGIPSRSRVLTDAEVRVVWGACQDNAFGKIIKLLLLCGCRRTEIGGLKWSEIDFGSGALCIGAERTKNGRSLTLGLAPAALEILRSVPRHDGQEHVFGKPGGKGFNAWSYSTIAFNNRIASMMGRPLPGWCLHDLRRTCRSGLGRLGVAPHVCELVIGHTRRGIEAVYDRHRYEPECAAALRLWSDHVLAVVEGKSQVVVPIRAA